MCSSLEPRPLSRVRVQRARPHPSWIPSWHFLACDVEIRQLGDANLEQVNLNSLLSPSIGPLSVIADRASTNNARPSSVRVTERQSRSILVQQEATRNGGTAKVY